MASRIIRDDVNLVFITKDISAGPIVIPPEHAWACPASVLYVSPVPSGFCQNLYLMHFFYVALSCSVIALIELPVLYLRDKYNFLLATDDPVRLISSLKYEGYGHFQEAA